VEHLDQVSVERGLLLERLAELLGEHRLARADWAAEHDILAHLVGVLDDALEVELQRLQLVVSVRSIVREKLGEKDALVSEDGTRRQWGSMFLRFFAI